MLFMTGFCAHFMHAAEVTNKVKRLMQILDHQSDFTVELTSTEYAPLIMAGALAAGMFIWGLRCMEVPLTPWQQLEKSSQEFARIRSQEYFRRLSYQSHKALKYHTDQP